MDRPGNPNPSYNYSSLARSLDPLEFELSDYLLLGDDDLWTEEMVVSSSSEKSEAVNIPDGVQYHSTETDTINNISYGSKRRRKLVERGNRVVFRTESEQEVMDDGYKWRKYGKKSIKDSPYPRNYYRCSSEGCRVKKKVERDREDPSYVITSYEGLHHHHHDCPSSFAHPSDDIGSLIHHY